MIYSDNEPTVAAMARVIEQRDKANAELTRLREEVKRLKDLAGLHGKDALRYHDQRDTLLAALREMVEDAASYSTGGCGADECGTQHDCGSPVVFRDFPRTLRARAAIAKVEEES